MRWTPAVLTASVGAGWTGHGHEEISVEDIKRHGCQTNLAHILNPQASTDYSLWLMSALIDTNTYYFEFGNLCLHLEPRFCFCQNSKRGVFLLY